VQDAYDYLDPNGQMTYPLYDTSEVRGEEEQPEKREEEVLFQENMDEALYVPEYEQGGDTPLSHKSSAEDNPEQSNEDLSELNNEIEAQRTPTTLEEFGERQEWKQNTDPSRFDVLERPEGHEVQVSQEVEPEQQAEQGDDSPKLSHEVATEQENARASEDEHQEGLEADALDASAESQGESKIEGADLREETDSKQAKSLDQLMSDAVLKDAEEEHAQGSGKDREQGGMEV
jgi:hypothetical protein